MDDHTSANGVSAELTANDEHLSSYNTDPNYGDHLTQLYEAGLLFSINIVDANGDIITTDSDIDPRDTVADVKARIGNQRRRRLVWRKHIDGRMATGGSGRRFIHVVLDNNLSLIAHKMFESKEIEVFESMEGEE